MGYKILYTSINYHIGNTFYDLTVSNSRKNNTFGTSKEGTVTGEKLQSAENVLRYFRGEQFYNNDILKH